MADRKKRFRTGLAVLVTISLFVCPLAAGGFGLRAAHAQLPYTPPIIPTLGWTQTAGELGIGVVATVGTPVTVGLPTPLPTPVMAPVESGQYAICGMLVIDSSVYAIGDPFSDASGIALGTVVNADPFGRNGYAEIRDQPDYRLVWVTSEAGVRQ
jgi:hypothetical protein